MREEKRKSLNKRRKENMKYRTERRVKKYPSMWEKGNIEMESGNERNDKWRNTKQKPSKKKRHFTERIEGGHQDGSVILIMHRSWGETSQHLPTSLLSLTSPSYLTLHTLPLMKTETEGVNVSFPACTSFVILCVPQKAKSPQRLR